MTVWAPAAPRHNMTDDECAVWLAGYRSVLATKTRSGTREEARRTLEEIAATSAAGAYERGRGFGAREILGRES